MIGCASGAPFIRSRTLFAKLWATSTIRTYGAVTGSFTMLMRRSRKPLSVFGGSRVQIPAPSLNEAGSYSEPASGRRRAVSKTFPVSPWKSRDVSRSPLVCCVTGEQVVVSSLILHHGHDFFAAQ